MKVNDRNWPQFMVVGSPITLNSKKLKKYRVGDSMNMYNNNINLYVHSVGCTHTICLYNILHIRRISSAFTSIEDQGFVYFFLSIHFFITTINIKKYNIIYYIVDHNSIIYLLSIVAA